MTPGQRTSLLSCFTPPQGYEGDFGWVCGFTANAGVLEEMASRFTRGARRRRASLALFLHPPEQLLPLIHAVAVPFRRPAMPWRFSLLHAKVALLHYKGKNGAVLRLIVSTGNWTHDPLGTSLDLFWIAEWHEDAPRADAGNRQAASDIRAAAAMFEWIRTFFDTSALEVDVVGGGAEAGLRAALARLPSRGLPRARFVDNRKDALQPQVIEAVLQLPGRRGRLVMGSGYFETGENAELGVLSTFVEELRDKGLATRSCQVDVVLNWDSCQGLAAQASAIRDMGWSLRPPLSREMPGAKLHAKFIFGAGGSVSCTNPWCYIGSGNLSRIGFTRSAGNGGNLEAGVVFSPEDLCWSPKGENSLSKRLPVDLNNVIDPVILEDGEPFEPHGPPAAVPPVAFLVWRDGMLRLPDDAGIFPELTVRVASGSWEPLPLEMPDPPVSAFIGPMMAEVPVLTDQGFMLPPAGPKRVEDVLHELLSFPQAPGNDPDWSAPGDIEGELDGAVPLAESGEYPLRRMMRLITRLTEHQTGVELAEWERWINLLSDSLTALTEPESEMLEAVRSYGVDLLDALLHPDFRPAALSSADLQRLETTVSAIRAKWKLTGLEPLYPREEFL